MAHRHGKGWRGSVRVPGSVAPMRRGGFPTKSAAERWERDTAYEVARGTYRDPDAGAVTFSDWCDHWLATRGTLKRSSSTSERSIVETHLRPALGPVRMDGIGPLAVRTLVSTLTGQRAPKTVRNVHHVLHNIFALAVEEGVVTSNPCTGTRLPKNKRAKARAFLTEQQVEQIITTVPAYWRPLVILLATTGLRWGEVAGLRVKYVDLLGGKLRVEETANEAEGRVTYGTPKSEASVRTVSLPARAVDALVPLVAGKDGNALVFTAPEGGPVRHRNFSYRVWDKAMRALELADPKPSLHDLRHAHASVLVSRGVPMMAVKERLGHDNISTTDKLYAFLAPSVDAAVVAALDAAFGDPLSERVELPLAPSPEARP